MSSETNTAPPRRLAVLDAQRGFIMIVMALDHASMFIAMQHYSEFWGIPLPTYPSAFSLFTRVITHLCAPGFFFLMGVGMQLFWTSRKARGWSEGRIVRHFVTRGLVLVVMDIFIITPSWILGTLDQLASGESLTGATPGGGGDPLILIGVLAALGASMALASLLLRFGAGLTAALGFVLLLVCPLAVPDAARVFEPMSPLARLLLVSGHDGILIVLYPVLPWLPICLFGIVYGRWISIDTKRALEASWVAGLVGVAVFVAIRIAGGFGTHHPMAGDDWMALLTVTKYPPSIAFILLSLSVNALAMSAFYRGQSMLEGAGKVLLVFGRAPLFFYVAHLYLYALVGLAYPGTTSLLGMYPVWILGLIALYPACVAYARFKGSKPEESLWRLF